MSDKLMAKPDIVLREEFDDWAVLFDPDTGKTCGLSPTGVFIWKQLNGTRNKDDILKAMIAVYGEDIKDKASSDYDNFIEQLRKYGLVSI